MLLLTICSLFILINYFIYTVKHQVLLITIMILYCNETELLSNNFELSISFFMVCPI